MHTGVSQAFRAQVSQGVSDGVAPKIGVSDGVSGGGGCSPGEERLEKPFSNQGIYLHRNAPLLENGLDRPENCYGRHDFASFFQHSYIYRRVGWSQRFSFLALWVVVVVVVPDIFQFPGSQLRGPEVQETTKDPEVEGSRSYQSSVTPAVRIIRDRSLLTS